VAEAYALEPAAALPRSTAGDPETDAASNCRANSRAIASSSAMARARCASSLSRIALATALGDSGDDEEDDPCSLIKDGTECRR
jgi:hypothetical protein